jgi:hypothetical protein
MKRFTIILGVFLLAGLLWLSIPSSAEAGPAGQAFYYTPTPGVDGRIMYTVKDNDTCISISLLNKVDLAVLRTLNNLDEACGIMAGQKLLLGIYEVPTITPGPSPIPSIAPPTPTPEKGNGNICIFLFEDTDGNAVPGTGEIQLAGGVVSMVDREAKVSRSGNTTNSVTPLCFEDIPEGEYNISVAPPEGYNATTSMNYPLKVEGGDSHTIDFGAQKGSQAVNPPDEQQSRSPLMAILGGILVLGGLGLGIYILFMSRR